MLAAVAVLCILAIVATIVVVRVRSGAVTYTTVRPKPVRSHRRSRPAVRSTRRTRSSRHPSVGTISAIATDFNAHVKKGQILARIDRPTSRPRSDQSEATLATERSASAGERRYGQRRLVRDRRRTGAGAMRQRPRRVLRSRPPPQRSSRCDGADDGHSGSGRADARPADLTRDKQLLAQGYIAQSQADTDQSNLVAAQTTLAGARAAVTQSQAQASAAVAQIATANATAQEQTAQTGRRRCDGRESDRNACGFGRGDRDPAGAGSASPTERAAHRSSPRRSTAP